MFSKPSDQKCKIKGKRTEKGTDLWSKNSYHYNLPGNKVLFLTPGLDSKLHYITTLKIFSMDNLYDSIKDTSFSGSWDVLSILQDGSFWLKEATSGNPTLIKFTQELTLCFSDYFDKTIKLFYPIEDKRFIAVKENVLLIYNVEKKHIEFKEAFNYRGDILENQRCLEVIPLGKYRFCFYLYFNQEKIFRLLISEFEASNNTFNHKAIIEPKIQDITSGKVILLPDGTLLTYHPQHENVQIWDSETAECIKEWNWSQIAPVTFSKSYLEMIPFPDSYYLLVKKKDELAALFMFNIYNLSLIPIIFSLNLNPKSNPHILPNSEVLDVSECRSSKFGCGELNYDVIHFGLTEIKNFTKAKEMTNTNQKHVHSFFLAKKFPDEINKLILSYAFTLDALNSLTQSIEKADDIPDEPENYCTLI